MQELPVLLKQQVLSLADMIDSNICHLIEELNRLLVHREWSRPRVEDAPSTLLTQDQRQTFNNILKKMADAAHGAGLIATMRAAWWAEHQTRERQSISVVDMYHHLDSIYGSLIMETSHCQFLEPISKLGTGHRISHS